jgi:hypothetical protein
MAAPPLSSVAHGTDGRRDEMLGVAAGTGRRAHSGARPALSFGMHAVLLALLLLLSVLATVPMTARAQPADPFAPPPEAPFAPAPIDGRLDEPLRLLAEVRDRDGEAVGEQYALLVRALNLTLRVAELRQGVAGSYTIPTRTVTIAEAALHEDPKFVAAALAHEIKHADDADFVGLGLLAADCVEIEARGFDVQAQIARAFWHDTLPTRTAFEQELAALVGIRERGGLDAIRAWVGQHPGYQRACIVSTGVSDEVVALGPHRRAGEP